jgi:hypothetical protein
MADVLSTHDYPCVRNKYEQTHPGQGFDFEEGPGDHISQTVRIRQIGVSPEHCS